MASEQGIERAIVLTKGPRPSREQKRQPRVARPESGRQDGRARRMKAGWGVPDPASADRLISQAQHTVMRPLLRW